MMQPGEQKSGVEERSSTQTQDCNPCMGNENKSATRTACMNDSLVVGWTPGHVYGLTPPPGGGAWGTFVHAPCLGRQEGRMVLPCWWGPQPCVIMTACFEGYQLQARVQWQHALKATSYKHVFNSMLWGLPATSTCSMTACFEGYQLQARVLLRQTWWFQGKLR
jgi:hypothetical protein